MVLIRREVADDLYRHAASELHHEVGGYLLGFPAVDFDDTVHMTYIETAVPAVYASTPTFVTMHPESFAEVERVREQTGTILVGYYHSHPALRVFQSDTDVENFSKFHAERYQIAVVVDPTRTSQRELDLTTDWIGFFAWNGQHKAVRLPSSHLVLVEQRPEITYDLGRVSNDSQAAMGFAATLRRALSELHRGEHRLQRHLPVLVVSRELHGQLLRGNVGSVQEGVLYGSSCYLDGYTFACLSRLEYGALAGSAARPNWFRSALRWRARLSPGRTGREDRNALAEGQDRPIGFVLSLESFGRAESAARLYGASTRAENVPPEAGGWGRQYRVIARKDRDAGFAMIRWAVCRADSTQLVELPAAQVIVV